MPAWFVTGSGTDVGKTFVVQGLVRHMRQAGHAVDAIKPVVSGFTRDQAAQSDSGVILDALGLPLTDETLDRVSPWRFGAPLAPSMAAARENRHVPYDDIVRHTRAAAARAGQSAVFIEGVGGVMAPLDDTHTVLDWMKAAGLPIILVTGSYLGAISHTLTAVDTLKHHQLTIALVVVSESADSTVPLTETTASIAKFINLINVIDLPRLAAAHAPHRAFGELAAALI